MTLGPAVPALPIANTLAALQCYSSALGFTVVHADDGFAIVQRDSCVIHLWLAGDSGWRDRPDFAAVPVRSGAEDFIAGTASCRIPVGSSEELDAVYAEMRDAGVLHPVSRSGVVATDYGTREVHVSDVDNNLLTFYTEV